MGGIFDPDSLRHDIDRITELSAREGFWSDQDAAQKQMKERAAKESQLNTYLALAQECVDQKDLLELASDENDQAVIDEVFCAVAKLADSVRALELSRMLSPEDDQDAIVGINSGAGGTDAQDWAEMLLRMYTRWCERKGYAVKLIDKTPGSDVGISSASILVRGTNAYGFLRAENGVHRLIRVSEFSGRRETSFAGVSVVPDLDDSLSLEGIEIKDEDLEVTTMRSGGAGGQHVNRTESAVRIRHLPTGFVVRCEQERSQHQNRETALKMLRGLLFEKQRREKEAAFEEAFLSDQGDIAFGNQARTYTLHPYTMVKDERTDLKITNANGVLDGDLDPFIERFLLATADKKSAKAKSEDDTNAES